MTEVRWWMKPLDPPVGRCTAVGANEDGPWRCAGQATYIVTIDRSTNLLCLTHTSNLLFPRRMILVARNLPVIDDWDACQLCNCDPCRCGGG